MFPDNIWAAFCEIDPTWLIFACAFIFLDVVTGIAKACSLHEISSEKAKTGFWHKLAIVTALVAAGLLDAAAAAGLDLGFQVPIFEAACGYVILMELMSIIENVGQINPELQGTRLLQLFAVHNDKEE